jgi:hypothetical protein
MSACGDHGKAGRSARSVMMPCRQAQSVDAAWNGSAGLPLAVRAEATVSRRTAKAGAPGSSRPSPAQGHPNGLTQGTRRLNLV